MSITSSSSHLNLGVISYWLVDVLIIAVASVLARQLSSFCTGTGTVCTMTLRRGFHVDVTIFAAFALGSFLILVERLLSALDISTGTSDQLVSRGVTKLSAKCSHTLTAGTVHFI